MMLDAIVDAVDYTTSAETNIGNSVSSADEVFAQFLALCQAPAPALRAGRSRQTVAQRVAGLFAGRAAHRSRRPTPTRPAHSATGTCCNRRSPRTAAAHLA